MTPELLAVLILLAIGAGCVWALMAMGAKDQEGDEWWTTTPDEDPNDE